MPTVPPSDGPSRSGPPPRPVSSWKKPIGYLLAQNARDVPSIATEDDIRGFINDLTSEKKQEKFWGFSLLVFLMKRNLVEAGGILAAIGGVFFGILGLIGIDRACKWGGLLFIIGGAVAAVAGKMLGVSLSTKEKGSEDVGGGSPKQSDGGEEEHGPPDLAPAN